MKSIAISALVAGGLFAGLFGAAAAQAQPLPPVASGAIGTQADATPDVSHVTNRDVVLPDGSINRNGGRLDQDDVLAPSRMPVSGSGNSVWHRAGRFGYGYGTSNNYLLWD